MAKRYVFYDTFEAMYFTADEAISDSNLCVLRYF